MADQDIIRLSVRSLDRGQLSYELAPNTTVAGLKEKVAADTDYPSSRIRLLHRGRELTEDTQTLAQLNLPENVVFHCAIRAAPTDRQRRAPAAGGATGGGSGGPQGPFVTRAGQPGNDGPGINITPDNFMQFLQGGGPGGLGGIFGSVAMGPGGGVSVGGPSADQLNSIQEAISRMFGGGGAGPGDGGNQGQRSRNNRSDSSASGYNSTPHAGFGAMPFMYPFGPSGQPIPGLSSETVARGGDPILNSNGEYTQRSVFGGLDDMLLRLQNGNMARDSGPALFLATRDSITPGNSTNAWAQAAHTFLHSCRTILSNTSLNRETLAAVNRIFSGAGLQPLALGVRSFPINADDDDDDDDRLPDLIYSDDSIGCESNDWQYSSDDDEEESESDDEADAYYMHRQAMRAMYGSDYTSNEEEDEEEDEDEDEDEDDDWETDEESAASESEQPSLDQNEIRYEQQVAAAAVAAAIRDGRIAEATDAAIEAVRAAAALSAATDAGVGSMGRVTESTEGTHSSSSSGDSSPPPLVSDPDEEEPQPRAPPLASRAARRGSGRAQQPRQQQQQPPPRGRDSTARARLNNDSDDSMPGLLSEDDSDSDASSNRRNVRQRTRAPAPAAQRTSARRNRGGRTSNRTDPAWFRAIPDDDLILVAAVTTGELARRFMSVLGQENNPVQVNAMIMRLATRLRCLSSLEGIGRMELARQISLVGGHVSRIAATAAEMGRTMEYLHSAFASNNLYFLQMIPGYIGFENDRAVSNMSIMRTGPNPTEVVGGGYIPGNAFPNMHAVGVRILPVNVGAVSGTAGAGGANNNSTTAGGGGGTNNANATAGGQSPNTGPGGRFVFTSVSGQAPAAGGAAPPTTGAPVAGQTPARASSLSALSAVARHFVNSTVQDIPSLTSEIAAAVTGTLSQSIPEVVAQNTTGAAASMIAARTAGVVDGVLRRHFSQIVDAPEVQQHSQQLRELLGVDIADILRNINTLSQTGQTGRHQSEEEQSAADLSAADFPPIVPATEAPPAAGAAAAAAPPAEGSLDVAGEVRRAWTRRSDTLAAVDAAPALEKDGTRPEAAAEESEKQQEASIPASQEATRRPSGPSLPPRRTAPGGPSLPARRSRPIPATPTPASAAPTATGIPAAAFTRVPAAAAAAPSGLPAGLGDLLGGAGGAGGLGGMLQNMMSSPALGELARNPSMQQAASQLFGGGGGGGGANGAGGGLNIGALMNSAGPMLSQLMGGGMAAPAAPSSSTTSASQTAVGGGGARRTPAPAPAPVSAAASIGGDLDVTLASALTADEATRWKTILQADDEAAQKAASAAGAQQERGDQEIMGFSDAYLAAMPPRAASGLLQGLLGGQD